MILQLSPDTGRRTYEHERVYIVANRKALESYDRLSKLCKCMQRIYGAKIVQIRGIVKRRAKSFIQKGKGSESRSKKPEAPRMPADDEDDGHGLLEVRNDPNLAPPSVPSPSRTFFKTMKKHNVSTCINELYKLEQRQQFTRPVSYLYCA